MNVSLIIASLCAAMVFPLAANADTQKASPGIDASIVLPERMNLRAGPNIHARILRGLPRGASGPVVQAQGEWSQIRVFGTLGWVHLATRSPGHPPAEAPVASSRARTPAPDTTLQGPPMPPLPRTSSPTAVHAVSPTPTQAEDRTTIATIRPAPRAANQVAADAETGASSTLGPRLAAASSAVLILLASWGLLVWIRKATQPRAFGFLDEGLYTDFSSNMGASA